MQHIDIITNISKSEKSLVALVEKEDGQLAIYKKRKNLSPDLYYRLKSEKLSCTPEIYEIETEDDAVCILEEHVTGITLQEALTKNTIQYEQELIKLLLGICRAGIQLHSCNPPIIYRDFKPENIIITDDGNIKLIDFDAAREYKCNSSTDTVLLGTREYAAPEQYGFAQTDERSDIYSFGIVLKELTDGVCLSGRTRKKLNKLIRRTTMFDPADRISSFDRIEKKLLELQATGTRYMCLAAVASVIFLICGWRLYISARPIAPEDSTYLSETDDLSENQINERLEQPDDNNGENTIAEPTIPVVKTEKELFEGLELEFDDESITSLQMYNLSSDIGRFWGYPDHIKPVIFKVKSFVKGKPVEIADRYCMTNRPSVEVVVLEIGLVRIETCAFAQCPNLSACYIPSTVNYIEDDAFSYSEKVTIFCMQDTYAMQYAIEHGIAYEIIE